MIGPRSTWKDATRIYSTWRSVESAGYCDLSLALRRSPSDCCGIRLLEDGVEGLLELLMEPLRPSMGGVVVGAPLRIEGLEGVRDDGKDDSEA